MMVSAPFPWFGGKRKVAHEVWARFGEVGNFCEPFFGSGAVLLGRPQPFDGTETVNDKDGLVCNFWRAMQAAPEETAHWADYPVNENDLHARHVWLIQQLDTMHQRLEGDPHWYDAKIAGWWVWGICNWIGGGFCSGQGPWWPNAQGLLVREDNAGKGVSRQLPHLGDAGKGVSRQLPHLGNAGQGVKRQLPHLGNAGKGVSRQLPHLGDAGQGVHRKRPHLGNAGKGVSRNVSLMEWFQELSARLTRVRVCSGDWSRVCGPSVTVKHGLTGVFLDPPYADTAARDENLYRCDSVTLAHDVREWAIARGDDPLMRIALCGYEGEHVMPESWSCLEWNAGEGYGGQSAAGNDNGLRERIWFSPSCLAMPSYRQEGLYG